MINIENIIDLLSRRLEWDAGSINIVPVEKQEAEWFYYASGSDSSTLETINALLYFDDELVELFDINTYEQITKDNDIDMLITVFRNYERENELFTTSYKTICNSDFERIWDEKVSIYLDSSKNIKLSVDMNGINYLENIHDDITGYIYNVNMAEIIRIINCTGINLFRNNVRIGLKIRTWSSRLRVNFKDYILSAILEMKDYLDEYNLEETINKALVLKRNPNLFWFSHNGISIYSKLKDNKDAYRVIRESSTIELDPFRISVINGAQTITNFFKASDEVKNLILNTNKSITVEKAKEIVTAALEKIMVKAIIICGPTEYISDITLGLNTQIPVGEDAQVLNESTIKFFNRILGKENIKLVRPGEYMDDYCLPPQKLAKLYFVVKGEPGKARNLNLKNLDAYFKDIKEELKNDNGSLLINMKTAILSSIWWKNNSVKRIEASKGIENIMRNANYYFWSFVNEYIKLANLDLPISDEQYLDMFESLVHIVSDINDTREKGKEVNSNDFKGDDMYKIIISNLEKELDEK